MSGVRYASEYIPQGCDCVQVDGIAVPEPTRQALARAQGALRRTVYAAADEQGRVAALLEYHRPHTASCTLSALSGDGELAAGLLDFAERKSHASGSVDVRHDASADIGEHRHRQAYARHYRQTTEFTCGPVAVLNALHRRGVVPGIDREAELRVWREATLVLACDPYGLAVAASRRGITPVAEVSTDDPVLDPSDRIGIIDPLLAVDAQRDFQRQAHEAGITVNVRPFNAQDIARYVRQGHIVVVLIDEQPMHGEHCPHWVTVTGWREDEAGDVLLIDDPWTDEAYGETAVDGYQLAVRLADADTMIRYGKQPKQAMLVF